MFFARRLARIYSNGKKCVLETFNNFISFPAHANNMTDTKIHQGNSIGAFERILSKKFAWNMEE